MNEKVNSVNHLWLSRRGAIGLAGALAPALLPIISRMANAEVNFSSTRLSVMARGSTQIKGQDILLVPGLASGPDIWSGLVAANPAHRFHLVHIAGFAGKAAGPNGRSPLLQPLANELIRYARERHLRSPAIIGHSMGGTLAMMAALGAPSLFSRVMVVDMLPEGSAMVGGTSSGLGYLATQLNGYFTGTKAGRQLLAEMVRQNPGARDSDPNVIAQALTELAQTNLGPRLPDLPCPLTILYATAADAETRAAQTRRFRTAYAGARQASIIGVGPSGHMIMQDQPQKFASAVATFLNGKS